MDASARLDHSLMRSKPTECRMIRYLPGVTPEVGHQEFNRHPLKRFGQQFDRLADQLIALAQGEHKSGTPRTVLRG